MGQTCWFSAVIQSLFYIPVFRNLVLNFEPSIDLKSVFPVEGDSNRADLNAEEEKVRKVTELMLELRRLFALMLSTERKYVDPSKAIDILRGHIGSSNLADNQQEDVSEFTHILFEWAKEAFNKRDKKAEGEEKMDQCYEGDEKKKEMEQESKGEKSGQSGLKDADNPMAKLFFGKIQVEGT